MTGALLAGALWAGLFAFAAARPRRVQAPPPLPDLGRPHRLGGWNPSRLWPGAIVGEAEWVDEREAS